jgi:hypothetical protein
MELHMTFLPNSLADRPAFRAVIFGLSLSLFGLALPFSLLGGALFGHAV